MATTRKLTPVTQVPRIDFVIPPEVIKELAGKVHIVAGPGGGSIGVQLDIVQMKKPEFWQKLAANPEFNKNFKVMLVLQQ